MVVRYNIELTDTERSELERMIRNGKTASKTVLKARALLLCDGSTDGPRWTVERVAEAIGVNTRSIEHWKKRFVEQGMEAALKRKERQVPPREIQFDGAFDARLMQLACSEAPEGYARWTMRLLAQKVVELQFAPNCSPATVCRSLKKTSFNRIGACTGRSRPSRTLVS